MGEVRGKRPKQYMIDYLGQKFNPVLEISIMDDNTIWEQFASNVDFKIYLSQWENICLVFITLEQLTNLLN